MACGELPFNAPNTPSMLVKHLSERPVPVDHKRIDLPPDLARIIMLLLEKDPANRFPDAQSLVVALSGGAIPQRTLGSHMPTLADEEPQRRGSSAAAGARPSWMPANTRMTSGARSAMVPTPDELGRWDAPPVRKFRKKLAPYLAVNAIIVPLSIFGDGGFLFITMFWSIGMAVQYSKLWQDGYNWRDVFRQPRDRMLFDVAAETIDDARALFDESKREQVRARQRERERRVGGGLFAPPMAPMPPLSPLARPMGSLQGQSHRMARSPLPGETASVPLAVDNSPYGSALNQIRSDRDEIQRQLMSMTKSEREMIPDVGTSADAVYRKAMLVANTLAELDLRDSRDTPESIEREISDLEAKANPLDYRASEERVRRLAHLKRQRRVVADLRKTRADSEQKLEHCRSLLRSMRLELLRYRSAGMTAPPPGLTMVTQQAQVVVKEMGYLSDAAAEVNAL
jgi:serine/threonine-protein kinase